ncbi:MAG: tetratricopeptide repeat protein [candidate division Zixibacteria bacterium]|nr:tetratricopeptide repeat protein [candidate division Zixibacteria bacterium]
MVNHIRVVVILLSVLLVALSITGCKDFDGLRARFETEKLFYKATRAVEILPLSPGINKAENADSVRSHFSKVLDYVDKNVSRAEGVDVLQMKRLAGFSHLKIAETYAVEKEYVDSYQAYKKAVVEFSEDIQIAFTAAFRAAEILEKASDYRGALGEYESLFRTYPLTEFDAPPLVEYIESPVRVASLYLKLNDRKSYERALREARAFFQTGIEHFKHEPAIVNRFKLEIAGSYSAEGKHNEAIAVYNTITDAGGIRLLEVRLRTGLEYMEGLKDHGSAAREFRDIITEFPDSISISSRAQFGLAMVYYNQKDYESARDEFLRIEKDYPQAIGLISKGHWFYAMSFEKEGKWDRALVEYQFILANYPETSEGNEVPLHIAKHYLDSGDKKASEKSFENAITEYRRIISKFGKSPISSQAYANIAKCYIQQKKWDDAVEALLETWGKFPDSYLGSKALLTAADISEKNLKDNDRAIDIYKKFLDRYPWISDNDYIERKIERLSN